MGITPFSQSSEFLFLVQISDADVCKASKRLKPSKSVELGDISGFAIKGCSVIFIPVHRHIFNLSLTHQYFPTVWKEATILHIFKRDKSAAVSNYRPISILSNFSVFSEFINHDHVLHCVKLNLNHHGFTKSKPTVTNLVTFLDFLTSVVRG